MEIKLTQRAKELMASSIVDPDNVKQLANFAPRRATPESAGYDLRACIEEPIKIGFGETVRIPCGFHLWINDPNLVGKVYIRSSVGTKLGLVLANGVGIIDSDYQDEWKLAIHCYRRHNWWSILRILLSVVESSWSEGLNPVDELWKSFKSLQKQSKEQGITIYPAQRLAQVVFTQAIHPKAFEIVGEFSEQSERFGGFGSTNGERR